MLLADAAYAALAPFYQSAREIQSILEMRELYDEFGNEREIEAIVRNKAGYQIKSGNCSIQVEMKYVPTATEGGAEYRLRVGKMNCKQ